MIDYNKIKRVLVVRLSSLGDVLLTTPVIRSLKNKYPHLNIDFLVKEEYKQVYEYNPYVNALMFYKDDKNFIRKLAENNYDLILDLQNNFRSRKLIKPLNTVRRVFHKPTLNKFLLVKFKINRFKDIVSIPEYYARALDNFELDDKGLDLFLPEDIKSQLPTVKNYIGFCPGSKHFTKMWPAENFVELGNMFADKGFTVVLLGGKDDKEICADISANIKGSINLSNDNNLFQIAADMKMCNLVVCNDSGLMHTASAVQVPLVAIFGSTVKEFGFFPYKAKSLILENNLLNCRPCSHIGRNSCPKKHFKCMKEVTPGLVFENVQRFLAE